ncbi:UDP-N-acetyl-D-mannosamine dehydrogenase [Arthrobacter psychrolactophilus]|uniref:UDP-N-acetyl-D-mannosamine dehydrogenase n=1 Tax=Arthrobacter psychrolactophilus TaxID=92442 RepID=A0A2V5J8X1_9MICC|nr:UDP-N-acetyl-D-mannosamine dehydrogenase [Arthrobacter psychrolactophilus]PYI39590.1 UDP-N-acetyl-D-mannosamine dehydrogenase [Arthrobacter psychrolactophilus]
MNTINHVAVIGLGYIGLPTAAILASKGLRVSGVDVNDKTIAAVNAGEVPFVEPGLSVVVKKAVADGFLSAMSSTPAADAYIVAVPTPFMADKSVDVKYIHAAAEGIAPQLVGGELIILESTSPPGTSQRLGEFLIELRPDLALHAGEGKTVIHVAHCPERVLPGKIMDEMVSNDRIIGGVSPEAAELARDLYSVFCEGELLITDAATAELAKLVENSFRDVNIAFANELSVISEKFGVNVWELIELANHHPRVNILQPGPGVGGHCIAVDPWFIVAGAPEESRLIRTAREVNDAKPRWVVDKVIAEIEALPANSEVALLGLAFKANIDDLRESPAVAIALELAERLPNRLLNIAEPHVDVLPNAFDAFSNVNLRSIDEAIDRSGAVAILVDHDEVKTLDQTVFGERAVVDTRGIMRVNKGSNQASLVAS